MTDDHRQLDVVWQPSNQGGGRRRLKRGILAYRSAYPDIWWVDGIGVDGFAVDGSVVDGFAVDGIGVDGIGVDGFAVDGIGVDGFAVDGIGVDGAESVAQGGGQS